MNFKVFVRIRNEKFRGNMSKKVRVFPPNFEFLTNNDKDLFFDFPRNARSPRENSRVSIVFFELSANQRPCFQMAIL